MNSKIPFNDEKISLVNENMRPSIINHFQNKALFKESNFQNFKNENENNQIQNDEYESKNNRINIQENINNFNKNLQNQIINKNINNIKNNEEQKLDIYKSNDTIVFQNGSDDYIKQITINNQNEILKELEEKKKELKKMTELFDQLSLEYSKLNAKHNALMVYASDLQKKVDLYTIENKNKISQIEIDDISNRIIQEKENIISVLQNQVNYYKNNYNSLNQNYFMTSSSLNLQKQLDDLTNHYINENKKLKMQLKKSSKIDFDEFENQINIQIDNFNNIISNYNERLINALSEIPEFFNKNQKEEAAKFLVEQVNMFMNENQKLFSDNFRLNTQIKELEAQLNFNLQKKDFENENIELENRIEELESLIKTLSQNQNNNTNNNFNLQKEINNNEIQIKNCLNNAMNEIKEKDLIIANLNNKLNELNNKFSLNFDDKEVVNSMSKKLYEKDSIIQNLQNQLELGKNKVDEIRKNKNDFLFKINK